MEICLSLFTHFFLLSLPIIGESSANGGDGLDGLRIGIKILIRGGIKPCALGKAHCPKQIGIGGAEMSDLMNEMPKPVARHEAETV